MILDSKGLQLGMMPEDRQFGPAEPGAGGQCCRRARSRPWIGRQADNGFAVVGQGEKGAAEA